MGKQSMPLPSYRPVCRQGEPLSRFIGGIDPAAGDAPDIDGS
jgi:hypothetical protein